MSKINAVAALALASAVLAVPHNEHGHAHQHLHARRQEYGHGPGSYPHGPGSYGTASGGAPYPSANGTVSVGPTGGSTSVGTYTTTHTDFTTITSTLYPASGSSVTDAGSSSSAACGSDVTITTKETVYVTVTPSSSVVSPVQSNSTSSTSSKRTKTVYVTSTVPAPGSSSSSSAPATSSEETSSAPVSSAESSSSPAAPPAYSAPASSPVAPVSSSSAPAAPPAYSSDVTSSSSSSAEVSPVQATSSAAPTPVVTYSDVQKQATSASSAAPSPSSSYGSSSGGKRGLAYNDASLTNCFTGSSHVSWAYNWGSATDKLPAAWNYIPTMWGPKSPFTDWWSGNAQTALDNGANTLFSFNEPDMPSQANLSPEDAASGYQTYMMPYASKAKLCAPSVTNAGGEMGLTWLSNFVNACQGCQIDCINLHWYADAQYTDIFKDHINNATSMFPGKPIYVSEFGTTGGDTDAFLQEVMPWMDSNDAVAGYAYFMVSDGLLVSGTEPSDIGSTFSTYSG